MILRRNWLSLRSSHATERLTLLSPSWTKGSCWLMPVGLHVGCGQMCCSLLPRAKAYFWWRRGILETANGLRDGQSQAERDREPETPLSSLEVASSTAGCGWKGFSSAFVTSSACKGTPTHHPSPWTTLHTGLFSFSYSFASTSGNKCIFLL